MKSFAAFMLALFPLALFAGTYPIQTPANPFPGSRFYIPNDQEPHTSVIMLHGSEGGSAPYIDMEAGLLAAQGYSVLVFCYFDCDRGLAGPRETLKNVEVNMILNAIKWLRKQPRSNGKVAVYGFSRGAELTMIIGSLPMTPANRPDALIAHSPSDVFNGPYNWDWQEPGCWLCIAASGECNENSPVSDFKWNPSCGPDDLTKWDHSKSAWLVNGVNIPAKQRIEIEKYEGPILLTVGEKDPVWPTDQTRRIEATLKAAGRTPEVHYFPNAGHVFRGADEINRRQTVIDFLEKYLK